MSYNTKNYTEQNGDVTHIGGTLIFEQGAELVEGAESVDGYNTKNYTEQGGDVTHIGGKLVIEEGAVVEGMPSTATLIEKSITENGTYNATDDEADGYSSVTVDVAGGNATVVFANATYNVKPSLKSITVPDGVTKLDISVFQTCANLDEVILPNGLLEIGQSAFQQCDKLKNIIIPDTVTTIGSQAFAVCTSLESIEIPASVTTIGTNTFTTCSALETITINKAEGSITGAPWGAPSSTQIIWNG